MEEKNYDGFFDETTHEKSPQETLMAMVDRTAAKPAGEFELGELVRGTVHSIGKEYLYIELGQKNEAVIKKEEFLDSDGNLTIQAGDQLDAFVVSTEKDEIVLSKSLSGRKARIKDLLEISQNRVPVDGKITGINKGGFNVSVMGRKAFCPFSHLELHYIDNPNTYLLKTYPFVITRVESRGRNIVLSRLPLLEKDLAAQIDQFEKSMNENKPVQGTVSKVSKFGLFVDLGGVEGLVHLSEISWDRTEDQTESYKAGDTVLCAILKIERKEPLRNSKISLSIRMLGDNPWDGIAQKLSAGADVEGVITRLAKFGAFVQLLPGIEGLIHISEMSWTKRVHHPSEVVAEGDRVRVTILAIDERKRSVSCSLKESAVNPWTAVADKYPVGSVVTGTVASETNYGFFIDLDDDITGLLIRGKIGKEKKDEVKKGARVEVAVEEIDVENRRISLSCGHEGAAIKYVPYEKPADSGVKGKAPSKSSSEFGDLLRAAMAKKNS